MLTKDTFFCWPMPYKAPWYACINPSRTPQIAINGISSQSRSWTRPGLDKYTVATSWRRATTSTAQEVEQRQIQRMAYLTTTDTSARSLRPQALPTSAEEAFPAPVPIKYSMDPMFAAVTWAANISG